AMIVADTDVLIDFLAGSEPGADMVMNYLEQGVLCVSVITRFELLCGVSTPLQERLIHQLLQALPALSLNASASTLAAAISRDLKSSGEDIGMADCLIAGIVLENNARLLTRNRKHFGKVGGLELV
ncbi:type II toxin-antitoxin system VapC family toxin, partial [Gemmatimonadota bacterium]